MTSLSHGASTDAEVHRVLDFSVGITKEAEIFHLEELLEMCFMKL
jgi:hypothetical protein